MRRTQTGEYYIFRRVSGAGPMRAPAAPGPRGTAQARSLAPTWPGVLTPPPGTPDAARETIRRGPPPALRGAALVPTLLSFR